MFKISKCIYKRSLNRKLISALLISLLIYVYPDNLTAQSDSDQVPYEIAPIEAPFEMLALERPSFPDRIFDIRDYGAVEYEGDPQVQITDMIHQAIEAAHRSGGGKVLVPAGEWLTGPIHLMSYVNLHVEEGATVYFSEDREDYLPVVRQRHEGVEAYNYSPLIYAYKVENVAVTGNGVFDGQGQQWWDWYQEHGPPPRTDAAKVPLSRRDFGKGSGMEGMRPSFAIFWESENILVEGVTFDDGPMWNVHLIYSQNAIIRDITVNSLNAPNGDGLVIDSSKDVLVEYNHFETGDDAVVLKSGLNEDGLEINIPTENVVIRNYTAKEVVGSSGGVVFGSETSGGIRNVYVHDAYFEGSGRGVRFKTERGRGNIVENIYVNNIEMKNLTHEAINFNMYYSPAGVTGPSPLVRNVYIRDIIVDGVSTAINFNGLPEKWLENIHLENISIVNAGQGARINRAKNVSFKNVDIRSDERAMVASDVYEFLLDNVTLSNQTDDLPLLFGGTYNGAILIGDFPLDHIEYGEGMSDEILMDEEDAPQRW